MIWYAMLVSILIFTVLYLVRVILRLQQEIMFYKELIEDVYKKEERR